IVEDELIVARDIRKTLERNGYKVAGVARSAELALSMIEEERPLFVLVDIFLKGDRTGIDLAAQLNRLAIPFIYVSANSNQPVLEAAKKTNPYGFIVKPFREKDLLVTLEIARYRHEQNQQLQAALAAARSSTAASSSMATAAASSFSSIPATPSTSSPASIPAAASGAASSPASISTPSSTPASSSGASSPVASVSSVSPSRTALYPQQGRASFCNNIIGNSAAMLRVFNLIEQVAPFDTSVLLLGESGTGKEGVAECIFRQSRRSTKPVIKINCAAVPAGLMEAELFGYEKGAFTGASDRRAGKFELAHTGTMLLDEIGEMPLEMQVKLLRVLQEKEIQRIGSSTTIKTDVRVIAATSRNLEKEVAEGRFRLDLYYRLQVFPITLPPLRQRKEDIPLLLDHFIRVYAGKTGKPVQGAKDSVINSLVEYSWPGNVRELQHLVERSVLLASGNLIQEMPL
ncbi:MAG: sigma-54 dependent transcriptional regulator, partial [Chitinophaga rupis]